MGDDTTATTDTDNPVPSTPDGTGAPDDQASGDETAPENPAPPSRNASKATWVEYATTHAPEDQRLTAEEASAHTRNQLADLYTPAPEPEEPRTSGWFLCEGGSVIEMDLPLPDPIAERVVKGAIIEVADADGTPLETPSQVDLNAIDRIAIFAPPPPDASRAIQIGYAVRHRGLTVEAAEAMTTRDLVEFFRK